MAADEAEARRRNEQLVRHLESSGTLRDPAVAGAFRAVLRHRFLPDRPLDEVYEDAAVMTKTGEHGLPLSSSSQPAIMAIMLQILRLEPGLRVLEIGAGTGYNAALMAHLVGPDGRVTTLDIDADLVEQARDHLAEAGTTAVEVQLADGAEGWPAGAPYDRVIVTAGADDLSPAWADQLVDGGRLALPLGLVGPIQHCLALVKRGVELVSAQLYPCGFMPLRGEMAPAASPADEQLVAWLHESGRPTGYTVAIADLRAGFPTWLGLTNDGYVPAGPRSESTAGFGLRDERGLAVVSDESEGGRHPILVFGEGEAVAVRLVDAHRTWARGRPGFESLRITARPAAGPAPEPGRHARIVRRPHYTFVVRSE